MPTREAIVDSVIPREVEKPIPVRTISTRIGPRPNLNQASTAVESQAAESATPAESVRLSPQLTALARKEQAYRQREQALKEREKALEAKLADADQYSQLKSKIETKDYSEVERLGGKYEDYTKYLLDKQSGEDPNTQAFKKLEDEIQSLKKAQEEKATKEYDETVAEYKKGLISLSESNPEFAKVKTYKQMGADGKEFTGIDVALQFIVDSFNDDQSEITLEEALRDTTTFFKEQAKELSVFLEEPKVSGAAGPGPLPPPKVGSRTLTQQMQPSGIEKKPARSLQHMSETERYEEARRRVMERRQQEGR